VLGYAHGRLIEMRGVVRIVDGRSCKGCTLCCKVLAISELEKPLCRSTGDPDGEKAETSGRQHPI
jgi:hypothetical protein